MPDSDAVLEIHRRLGPGLKIVVLGSQGSDFDELTEQVAVHLDRAFDRALFISSGLPGVQETVAKSCKASKVYTLTSDGILDGQKMVLLKVNCQDVQSLLASIGDIYITIEGGQDVAEQANAAFSRGAAVIPVICTGGASSGMFHFPAAALKKPDFVSKEHWSFITSRISPHWQAATAFAVTAVVAGYSRGQTKCSEYGSLKTLREQKRMERLAAMTWKGSPWLSPYMEKLSPAVDILGHTISVVGPPVYWFYAGLYRSYKALPTEAASCLWGVGQCFFGGTYAAFFAAAEAFKTSGGDQVLVSLQDLKDDAIAVLEANSRQEKELGHSLPPLEKMKLLLRTVDPEHISVTVRSIWAGCMGMVMALKYKFARTVALAHSIGDHFRPLAAKALAPSALAITPPEYRQWIEPTINLTCKVVATGLAWKLQRVISAVQSGVAGGMLASRSGWTYVLPFLQSRNWMTNLVLEDSLADEFVGWGLAAAGIYFQIYQGGTPPSILLPVTLPMGLAESWLRWSVTWLGSE